MKTERSAPRRPFLAHPGVSPTLEPPTLAPLAPCLLAVALLAACASGSAGPPATSSTPAATGDPAPAASTETVETPAEASPAAVEAAIRRANAGDLPFRLIVHCAQPEQGVRNFDLLRGGAAIWKGETQVKVPADVRRDLLALLLQRDFASLEAAYGGQAAEKVSEKATETAGEKAGAPLTINCRVTFASDEASKTSVQQIYGEQSEKLIGLAMALLDRLEPLAAAGVTASDLADGLAKLAAGELAAETLEMRFVSLPGPGGSGDGFILRAEEAALTRRPYVPGRALGEAVRRPLDDAALTALVGALRDAGFADLPRNLYADDQLEVEVRVLGHHHAVLARPFAGMEPDAHGADQQRFDTLVAALRDLGGD